MSNLPYSYTFTTTTSSSVTTTINTITSPWMDSRIWSKLPQRLLDRVIAFLPPPAFFRARSVCKRWYSLLFSDSFLELYLQISPRRHWFIFFKHKNLKSFIYRNNNGGNRANSSCEGYLFDPEQLSWHRLSFPLIPPGFSPAASSGGLICWVSTDACAKRLILYNPLVGSLTPLPPTLRPRLFPSIGLSVTSSSIDISVSGDDLISPFAVKNISTESFHIDGRGFYSIWGINSSLPRLCSLESGGNYSPFSVLAYDIASNIWCKIQAPMRRFLRSPSLVESKGKLILVAAVEKSKLNVPKSLRLWSINSGGNLWVEIERMPQQLYVQFAELEGGRGFDCVAHGDFFVMMIRGMSEKALMFDIWRKRWQWVPPCSYIYSDGNSINERDGEFLHGFAYEPKLATPVTGLLDQLTLPFPFQSFNG